MQVPPPDVSLARVADSCRYVGSPYHSDIRSPGKMHRRWRPDASQCPQALTKDRDRIECWLRDAVRAGQVGAWEQGFPRYVWYRHEGIVYEARQGSPGSGEYHGYPLEPEERVRGFSG